MKDAARSPAGIVGLPLRARGEGKGMTPMHGPGQAVRECDAGRGEARAESVLSERAAALAAGRRRMGRWGRARDRPGWSGGALEQARSASHGVGSRGEKERERAAIPGLGRERRPMRGEGKRAG